MNYKEIRQYYSLLEPKRGLVPAKEWSAAFHTYIENVDDYPDLRLEVENFIHKFYPDAKGLEPLSLKEFKELDAYLTDVEPFEYSAEDKENLYTLTAEYLEIQKEKSKLETIEVPGKRTLSKL